MKDRVLIVDDMEINRVILREMLYKDYEIVEARNGMEAIQVALNEETRPDAVLLDIMMPEMDGFEVLQVLKSTPLTNQIPVLFITAADASVNETRGLREGAVDYISKPFNPDVVSARLANHIQLTRYRHDLERLVEQKTADLVKTHEQMLETMATIIEYRSLESGMHILRTRELTKLLVQQMLKKPLFHEQLVNLNFANIIKAVVMHDIGKVGIPDSILLKPGRLTPEEFEIIKTHTTIGSNIIDTISSALSEDTVYLQRCKEICRHHHERWNGTGYPDQLKGDAIPLSARILAVVDVYEALVSERCYKEPMSHEEAMKIIEEGRGNHFQPEIVDVFMEVQDQFAACPRG